MDWAVCSIDAGVTFDDDFFSNRDDDQRGTNDDGTALGTCAEIQASPEFAESCANNAMVQVCADKYHAYVECLYEAAAIHTSDGDLVCVELACGLGAGEVSSAVAARPLALAATCVVSLVLWWAVLPVGR